MAKTHEASRIDVHVGVNLRRYRTLACLSQRDIGKALGISFQQIQKYEKGTNRIGAGQLFILARLFEIDVSDFFEGLADKRPKKSMFDRNLKRVAEFIGSHQGQSLNLAYLDIENPRLRECILGLLIAMAPNIRRTMMSSK